MACVYATPAWILATPAFICAMDCSLFVWFETGFWTGVWGELEDSWGVLGLNYIMWWSLMFARMFWKLTREHNCTIWLLHWCLALCWAGIIPVAKGVILLSYAAAHLPKEQLPLGYCSIMPTNMLILDYLVRVESQRAHWSFGPTSMPHTFCK